MRPPVIGDQLVFYQNCQDYPQSSIVTIEVVETDFDDALTVCKDEIDNVLQRRGGAGGAYFQQNTYPVVFYLQKTMGATKAMFLLALNILLRYAVPRASWTWTNPCVCWDTGGIFVWHWTAVTWAFLVRCTDCAHSFES